MPALSRHAFRRLFAASLLVGAGVVGCTQLDSWQRQTIFSPQAEPQTWWREPAAGTRVYDLTLADGDQVRAWYWQSPQANAPTVLYLHGARWNLNGSAFRIDGWTRMGYSVLAIDYRGFGASTTRLPSEQSAQEDAIAGLKELARLQPDPSRRFVYGHSLGGAIAIDLASRPEQPDFAGLIVESSFTSIGAMLGTLRWGKVPGASLLVTQPFDSVDKLAALHTPMLFMHGTADRVVPHTMSDELFAAARNVSPDLKRLVKIEGASHSGAFRSGEQYETAVKTFMRDASRAYQRKAG
ncbi:alpha/beta fold hydrolase [Achromobacter denitrificans]|uniref:Alpha/beta fold hydrolase n=1 Tax=Achromobacter denitrificans TaxID=32002 RepID=A0A3R9H5F5_ACHDE|nr:MULTISPECIES: alpha/beta fold hydrolase [Achromobacter]ASC64007.1 alpha/beta hydrolase [Achromobacter denitrificans]MBV2158234.1 lysophospholipase [Achromobacter denitrificans]MDF3849709.1 alpha/beta fold hydrolase [Achromobacter denitrificans]MDF3857050.1 alpha/beta fold hydrolase [Achromobacter denitrificans]MDF3938647.1 alpha/beta fold hydrolase [Achromobacter denitrificans]